MNEGFDECLSEDDNDDGYNNEVFSEDSDYSPIDSDSDDSENFDEELHNDYQNNELLDIDNNNY